MCLFSWRTCKALPSVSSRREDAGRNRRHLDGISAIKLEVGPRYRLHRVSHVRHTARLRRSNRRDANRSMTPGPGRRSCGHSVGRVNQGQSDIPEFKPLEIASVCLKSCPRCSRGQRTEAYAAESGHRALAVASSAAQHGFRHHRGYASRCKLHPLDN